MKNNLKKLSLILLLFTLVISACSNIEKSQSLKDREKTEDKTQETRKKQ
ncbi:MAG: hypothetical protein Q4A42_05385 [Tissierellia bacterium]|nr:hypothetical protein [Tissierellia bacterium]